jgi:hypothetical protein
MCSENLRQCGQHIGGARLTRRPENFVTGRIKEHNRGR